MENHATTTTSFSSTTTHTSYLLEDRMRNRMMDISESYHLLMEVGNQDPVMQHCLKTLQGICLSQGIHMGKKKDTSAIYSHNKAQEATESGATEAFQRHLEKYYLPFCMEAIRCFFICGFVPWHVRRLHSTGDLVPEIVPLGTFTWNIELRSQRMNRKRKERRMPHEGFATSYVPHIISRREGNAWKNDDVDKWKDKWKEVRVPNICICIFICSGFCGQDNKMKPEEHSVEGFMEHLGIKRELGHPVGSRAVKQDKETQYVQYRVNMTAGDLIEDEIYIYDFVPPNFNVCSNSMLYATIPSPVAHLLIDYKNLRQAQIRRAHADAWNTQAHLVTTYKPGKLFSLFSIFLHVPNHVL